MRELLEGCIIRDSIIGPNVVYSTTNATITAPYTIADGTGGMINISSAGAQNVTLPTPVVGARIEIVNSGAGTLTVKQPASAGGATVGVGITTLGTGIYRCVNVSGTPTWIGGGGVTLAEAESPPKSGSQSEKETSSSHSSSGSHSRK